MTVFGAMPHRVPRPIDAPRVLGWPIVGSLPALGRLGALSFFERAWHKHGDAFRLRLGNRDVLAVVHPEAVDYVLVRRRENFIKGATYRHLRVLTGEGLLTLDGEAWRKRRRLAQPAFHKDSIRALIATMVGVTRDWLDDLHVSFPLGGALDAHPEMMRVTLEIVAATLFGQRFGAGSSDKSAQAFGDALELLSERGNLPLALPLDWPTPGNLRLRRALDTLDDMVYAIIRRAREVAELPAARPSLLAMLMASRDADTGEALSDRELRDEVITLVLAGHETTALLLSWGFTLLGRHPDVVARMRAEVGAVLGSREPTAEDLPKLVYMGQVIDEILRLHGPIWALARDVVGEDLVGGFRVHAGETVMPLPFLTHRHPGFWQEPDRFDPERFSPEHPSPPLGAYYPFSAGPRMCIGNVFTLSEAKVILSMLLQRADFELLSMKPVRPRAFMTVRPGEPIAVKLRWK